MIKMIRFAATAAAVVGLMPALASATVLTFDDLNGTAFFTADYDGFEFGNNDPATNPWFYTNTDLQALGAASGTGYIATDHDLYNVGTLQATLPISSATAFVFNGASFSGYSADTVQYQLYLGGSLVYTSAQSAPLSSTSVFFASGYSGQVDSVVVVGDQGYYALDNFTYNEVTAVPEPTNLALMLAGLVGVGSLMRRRRA